MGQVAKGVTLAFLTLTILPNSTFAQQDTSFWFVAPRTSSGHNPSPTQFVISNLTDVSTSVRVWQPANSSFAEKNITVGPGETKTMDISLSDAVPGDTLAARVRRNGFRITSDSPVQVYYQSSATKNNPDIYSLKGSNALGTSFTTPFQRFRDNASPNEWGNLMFNDPPRSCIDIVATKDNTTIEYTAVEPTVDRLGNVVPRGTTITFTLDEGQTYRIKAASRFGPNHLGGTKIIADKPIAVSVSDDSIYSESNGVACADLAGDQMIPESIIGQEYVVMRGWADLSNNGQDDGFDMVVLQPIEDNTDITVTDLNGNVQTYNGVSVENAAEHQLFSSQAYVSASKPIYVLHISGVSCELGGAILPPIDGCTGSFEVAFSRSPTYNGHDPNSEKFGLNIFVRSGSEGDFTVDGGNFDIHASDFNTVIGTNGE